MSSQESDQLLSKIQALKPDQIYVVDKFIDIFLNYDKNKLSVNASDKLIELSNSINDFAYKNGMTEDLAEKILKEIS